MSKFLQFSWAFFKHAYTFLVLFASDPFDIYERWFSVDYTPPHWLFWVLLAVAIGVASWLAIREMNKKKKGYLLTNIPVLLSTINKHVKLKVKKQIKETQKKNDILELNSILKKCMRVFGVTKELPKPTKIEITERYRKSIRNKILKEKLDQAYDKERSWELNRQVGGILDNCHHGLRLEEDAKYNSIESEISNITTNYIGFKSSVLTDKTNDYLVRVYASYSYLLMVGYWEILVNYTQEHGATHIVNPEDAAFLPLKYSGVNRYLSEELEKVKTCIEEIITKKQENDKGDKTPPSSPPSTKETKLVN